MPSGMDDAYYDPQSSFVTGMVYGIWCATLLTILLTHTGDIVMKLLGMYFGDVLGYVSNNGTGFLNTGYPQIHEIIMISVESATKCGNTRRFSAP